MTALLVTLFVIQDSLSLSAGQAAERDLGAFEYKAQAFVSSSPGGDTSVESIDRALTAVDGVRHATVTIESHELTVSDETWDSLLPFIEGDWTEEGPFVGRYNLTEGRWPASAGEVVIADGELLGGIAVGDRLPILSGRHSVDIVGIAEDRYSKIPSLLAGRGTWSGLDPSIAEDFPTVFADAFVYWSEQADSGGETSTMVLDALKRVAANEGEVEVTDGIFTSALISKDDTKSLQVGSWIDRNPAGFTVPLWTLMPIAVILMFATIERRLLDSLQILQRLGVRHRQRAIAAILSALPWLTASVLIGLSLGFLAGLIVREILSFLYWQPLAPLVGFGRVIVPIFVSVGLSTTAASLLFYHSTRELPDSHSPKIKLRLPFHQIRRCLAGIIALVAVILVGTLSTGVDVMILAGLLSGLAALLIPEIISPLLKILPQEKPGQRLAVRLLESNRSMSTASVATLTLMLGASLGTLVTIESVVAVLDNRLTPVPDGNIAIHGPGGPLNPPGKSIRDLANGVLTERSKGVTQLEYLVTSDDITVKAGADGLGVIAVTQDLQKAALLLNRPLTTTEREVLEGGGVLSIDGWSEPERSLYVSSGSTTTASSPLRTVESAIPTASQFLRPVSVVTLASTAEGLGFRRTSGGTLFTGLAREDGDKFRQEVETAGLSLREISIPQEPQMRLAPFAVYASAVGLFVLIIAASSLTARTQVRELKSYFEGMVSIGLSPRWLGLVALRQQLIVSLVAIVLGASIAITPLALAMFRIPGFQLNIPWLGILATLLVFTLAVGLTTIASTRRIRTAEGRNTRFES